MESVNDILLIFIKFVTFFFCVLQRLANLRSKKNKKGGKSGQNDGEFDDLISALRTGDVFNDDMKKLKVRKKSVPAKNLIQQQTNGNGRASVAEMSRERVGIKPKPGGAVRDTRTGAY